MEYVFEHMETIKKRMQSASHCLCMMNFEASLSSFAQEGGENKLDKSVKKKIKQLVDSQLFTPAVMSSLLRLARRFIPI